MPYGPAARVGDLSGHGSPLAPGPGHKCPHRQHARLAILDGFSCVPDCQGRGAACGRHGSHGQPDRIDLVLSSEVITSETPCQIAWWSSLRLGTGLRRSGTGCIIRPADCIVIDEEIA